MASNPTDTLFSILLDFCCTMDPELMIEVVEEKTKDMKSENDFTPELEKMFGNITEVCNYFIANMKEEATIEEIAMNGGAIDA